MASNDVTSMPNFVAIDRLAQELNGGGGATPVSFFFGVLGGERGVNRGVPGGGEKFFF